jgi:hypothetical protein
MRDVIYTHSHAIPIETEKTYTCVFPNFEIFFFSKRYSSCTLAMKPTAIKPSLKNKSGTLKKKQGPPSLAAHIAGRAALAKRVTLKYAPKILDKARALKRAFRSIDLIGLLELALELAKSEEATASESEKATKA